MRRLLLGFACVVALAPQAASAALSLQIGPKSGSGAANADASAVGPFPGEQFFDLTFNETGAGENEGLFAYDLLLLASPGVHLVRVEKPDNWVFTAPDASFSQAEADSRHILVNAINTLTGSLSDITPGSKAARVFYTLDTTECFFLSTITLDPNVTIFGSGDPNRDLVIPIEISDPGTIMGCPEPSALAIVCVAGVLGLRRRRSHF